MKHTMAEKLFLADLIKKVSQLEDQVEGNLRVSGDEDVQTFEFLSSDDEWEQTDLIRTGLRTYINQLLKTMAKLKRCVGDFDTVFSPEVCLAEDL